MHLSWSSRFARQLTFVQSVSRSPQNSLGNVHLLSRHNVGRQTIGGIFGERSAKIGCRFTFVLLCPYCVNELIMALPKS